MSHPESALTLDLAWLLRNYLEQHPIGYLTGPDGAMRLLPGLVRIPDIAFISWDQLPKRQRPDRPHRRLGAGTWRSRSSARATRSVKWIARYASIFCAAFASYGSSRWLRAPCRSIPRPISPRRFPRTRVLEGGDVLPGLALPLRRIFAEVPVQPKARREARKAGQPSPANGTA